MPSDQLLVGMENHQQWLNDIVLINESNDESVAGDVGIFRSVGEACRYLEDWWVRDQEGFAFTASGERLVLAVHASNRVVVNRREVCTNGQTVVQNWLKHSAASVLAARTIRSTKGKVALAPFEESGQLPDTVEGLIAYVGFDC